MEQYKKLSIKEWAEEDRPREKLLSRGIQSLTNAELLAILIRLGNKSHSAVELAQRLLTSCQNDLNELAKRTVYDLMQLNGIGKAKAISIIAAMELGRRQKSASLLHKQKIVCSKDAYERLAPYVEHLNKEEFWVIYLNRSSRVMEIKNVSSGGITGTVFDSRLVFKQALLLEATNLILCHNHPSGNLSPSKADKEITSKTQKAGSLMNIKILDHIIIGDKGYYSFADNGII